MMSTTNPKVPYLLKTNKLVETPKEPVKKHQMPYLLGGKYPKPNQIDRKS